MATNRRVWVPWTRPSTRAIASARLEPISGQSVPLSPLATVHPVDPASSQPAHFHRDHRLPPPLRRPSVHRRGARAKPRVRAGQSGLLHSREDLLRGHGHPRGRRHQHAAIADAVRCRPGTAHPRMLIILSRECGNFQSHNIPLVQEMPGVGQNLQDHLEVYVQQVSFPLSLTPPCICVFVEMHATNHAV